MITEKIKRICSLHIAVFAIITTAFADEAEDKAEFKRLYAEFNELYTNSEEIDPIIEVAEELYKLAPKIYGKNSQNTAVVTYNLASLYDEKGGETDSNDEERAFGLYEAYFEIVDELGNPQDQFYVEQFIQYLTAAINVNSNVLTRRQISKLEDISSKLELNHPERANLHLSIAMLYAKANRRAQAVSRFEDSLASFQQSELFDYIQLVEIHNRIANIELNNNNLNNAEHHLLSLIKIYDDGKLPIDDRHKIATLNLARLYFSKNQTDLSNKYFIASIEFEFPNFQQKINSQTTNNFLPAKRVNPYYPPAASKNRMEGVVFLVYDVDNEGNTKNIKVVASSSKIFEPNAITAVQGYEYQPTANDGRRIEIKDVVLRMEFVLAN